MRCFASDRSGATCPLLVEHILTPRHARCALIGGLALAGDMVEVERSTRLQ
jgi:hypothetical protein